jgi:hypothetical protein
MLRCAGANISVRCFGHSPHRLAKNNTKWTCSYYDLCNATSPDALPPSIQLPFNAFAKCEPSMAAIDPKCSDALHGFPSVSAAVLATTMQPNGTGTLFNQAGTMTAAPYGSTTAWYFLGSTGPTITATAVPYKAVEGSGSSSDSGSGSGGGSASGSPGVSASGSGSSGSGVKQGSAPTTELGLESFALTMAALILGLL